MSSSASTLFVLVGGVGAWSASPRSPAVVAVGQLKVESNRQVVQHLDGGVVTEIMVKDGDTAAGETLLKLDDKLLAAELAITEGQLFEVSPAAPGWRRS